MTKPRSRSRGARPRVAVPVTVRAAKSVMGPAFTRCALCQLSADNLNTRSVTELTIKYGGDPLEGQPNELTPLWKFLYLCEPCIEAIQSQRGRRIK